MSYVEFIMVFSRAVDRFMRKLVLWVGSFRELFGLELRIWVYWYIDGNES